MCVGRFRDGVLGARRYRWTVIDGLPASPSTSTDHAEIESIVRAFFAAFTSGPDSSTRLSTLRSMFLPQAVITRTCGFEPVVYGVEGFIAPRETLLAGGTLADFRESSYPGAPTCSAISPTGLAAMPRQACRTECRSLVEA